MFPRLALILIFATAAVAAQAESVTITRPGAGVSVTSPVRVTASAQGSSAVWLMQVYVDGVKKYEAKAASLDKSLTMASGSRRITVVAHDKDSVFKSSVTVNVSGSTTTTTSGSTSSSTETVNTDIEQRTGWQDCDACSGPDGAGEQIGYSMQQNIASPSKDGNSAKFRIWANDDGDHYGSALWWKELGGKDASTNFVYELDFYLKDPTKAQALEFDVNQLHSGHKTKYIFGTECDIKGTKQWRYYDNVAKKWAATGVTCAMPTAYTWNHLMLEFKRVSDGRLQFIAVTLNGKKSYFNKYSNRNTGTANYAHINVAVQLDGNSSTAAYDMWVDNVKLRHW